MRDKGIMDCNLNLKHHDQKMNEQMDNLVLQEKRE